MNCPACGFATSPTSTICPSCGASLSPAPGGATIQLPLVAPGLEGLPRLAMPFPAQGEPRNQPRPVRADVQPYQPVLGPADRESFFAAQRRHRRATWRLVAVCTLAAVVTGVPLSLILTPLLFGFILIATRLIHVVTPVPDGVWDAYERVGLIFVSAFEAIDESTSSGTSDGTLSTIPWDAVLTLAGIWLVPGVLLMLVMWPVIAVLFRHAGGGGALLSLGAREPRTGDLEEQQLANVVHELAIAAGITPPPVMLIDVDTANAAIVGSSPENAVVVVSRALLDELDREETQGVLAHLVASIGNGDPRGASSILAVFQTFGFASALLRTPIDGQARRTVWRMLRYVFGRHRPSERAAEAQVISNMLTSGLESFGEGDDLDHLMKEATPPKQRPGPKLILLMYYPMLFIAAFIAIAILEPPAGSRMLAYAALFALPVLLILYQWEFFVWSVRRGIGCAHAVMIFPYYMGSMMPLIMLMMLKNFLLEPVIARLWRTRRLLADASAVQLIRYPDGLARGLGELIRRGAAIPGGAWAAPLFIVGAEGVSIRVASTGRQRIHAMEQGWAAPPAPTKQQRQSSAPDEGPFRTIDPQEMDGPFRQPADRRGSSGPLASRDEREASSETPANRSAEIAAQANVGFTGSASGIIGQLHPRLDQRLRQLRALGASEASAGRPAPSGGRQFRWMSLLAIPLFGLIAILMVIALTLLAGLALLFTSFLMMIVWGLFFLLVPA